MSGATHDGWEHSTGSIVPGETGLAHTGAIVNNERCNIIIHGWLRKKKAEKDMSAAGRTAEAQPHPVPPKAAVPPRAAPRLKTQRGAGRPFRSPPISFLPPPHRFSPRPLEGVRRHLPDFGAAQIWDKGSPCALSHDYHKRQWLRRAAPRQPPALRGPPRPAPEPSPATAAPPRTPTCRRPPPGTASSAPRPAPGRGRRAGLRSATGRMAGEGGGVQPKHHSPSTAALAHRPPARSLCSPRGPPHRRAPPPAAPPAHSGAHQAPSRARRHRAARSRTRRSPHARTTRTKIRPGAPQGFHAAREKKRAIIKPSDDRSPEDRGRAARSPVGVTRSVRAGAGGARRRRSGARGEGSAQRLPPAARSAFYRAAAAAASP